MKFNKIFKLALMVLFVLGTTSVNAAMQHSGVIKETMTAGVYTYMNIEEDGKTFWIAAPKTTVNVGDKVSFDEELWMPNFKSKALDRTFDRILFVAGVSMGEGAKSTITPPGAKKEGAVINEDTPFVDSGTFTIAEIYEKRLDLNNTGVTVKGEVVKVSAGIMGTNWIHIQDGTGSASKGTNNLIFRSAKQLPPVGAKVLARGILETDKDFGAGYFYSAIVEEAEFAKQK